ncbi:hypothetical protein [uncultured Ilumatobacter sp.]|jgi:hypothetical protein|uniref:hypothetical protein n=1 Tax=uncultured Ilumatobacter sp. TaxID=879968 RepID=UPI00374FD816
MLIGMMGLGWDEFAAAPTTSGLVISALLLAVDAGALWYAELHLAPKRPKPVETSGALRHESPAVVNMLTNDAVLTASGFRATVIDLAARGWLRLLPPLDDDDDLGRVRPAATAYEGDALLPHERLVLQHVMARFTTDRAIPARFLAVDIKGSWWRRFRSLVTDDAQRAGLVTRRWPIWLLATPGAIVMLSAFVWWGARNGDAEIAVVDSVERRVWAAVILVGIVALCYRIVRHTIDRPLTHTEAGLVATQQWLSVRQRLIAGDFGQMAASSLEVGDRRLAYASATCLADGAAVEFPLAREDHHRAWSSVGAEPRLVRVKYPIRLGYGLHPVVALVGGVITAFVGLNLRRFFSDTARGDALDSLYERFPEQGWLVADVATGLTVLTVIPIVIGLIVAIFGAADVFSTVERTGIVLRARRPAEVAPLPRFVRKRIERDRYSLFVAVDDGKQRTVYAWRSGERNAIPQGANATVRASPILGYVRRATPVGHLFGD